MSLIKCPECGKEISEHAKECPNCGFPIEKKVEEDSKTNSDIPQDCLFICPRCAMSYPHRQNPSHICKMCNIELVKTDLTLKEFVKQDTEVYRERGAQGSDDFERDLANKYGGNQFSDEAYRHRLAVIKQQNAERARERELKKQNPNQVHCPYCNSLDVKKISNAGRNASIIGFGILSKKIGKQWHCNSCKSDF